MFVILLHYCKPLEVIDEWKEAHFQYMDEQYEQGAFICSGRKEPRTGGVILASGDDEEQLWETIRKDPFYIRQAAEYQAIRFIPSRFDERFRCFVD